jgi:trichodiene synthase
MDTFPTEYFLGTAVRLLENVKYRDSNYTREERIENLRYAYNKAAAHFSQERQQRILKTNPKRLEASLRTIVGMVVYSWTKVSKELMADLSIHYTYTLILDDSEDDPHPQMLNFFDDLQSGRQQEHPWWMLVNEHFPNVLRHFGPFCSLNLIRSTLDCKFIPSKNCFVCFFGNSLKLKETQMKFSRVAGLSNITSTAFPDLLTILASFAA